MIQFCIIVSFVCAGVYFLTGDGALLGIPASWMESRVPQIITKPLFGCLPCMASVWTLILWMPFHSEWSWKIIIDMLVVCGMNTILLLISVIAFAIDIWIEHEKGKHFSVDTSQLKEQSERV